MTESEFRMQISRLEKEISSGLGLVQPLRFGNDRGRILWSKVQALPGKWFATVIDYKIASCRQMPLPADFDDDILQERERLWAEEKKQSARDAKDLSKSEDWGKYANEEKQEICRNIRDIMSGKMTESDAQKYIGLLRHSARELEKSAESAKEKVE